MRGVFKAFTAFSSIFGSSGVIFNLVLCLLYLKNPQLLDAPNIFILSIAVGDFAYSIVAFPLLVSSNARGEWLFGEAGCTAYGFLTSLFGLGSMMHLAGEAYERYTAFTRLVDGDEAHFSKKKALIFSMLLWCYSFFWSLMPVFGWSSFVQEGIGTSCAVDWRSKEASDVSFALCLMVACFLLPVAIIIYCYYKCYRAMHQLAEYAFQNWGENTHITKNVLEAEREMAKIAVTMTAGFLVAWTPYAVASVVAMFNASLVSDITASVPAYIAKSSACYNPLINLYMNKKLRGKLAGIFCCKMSQVHPQQNVSVHVI